MVNIASITFDMDDLDVLTRGAYKINEPFSPVVYRKAVPRMLELLDEVSLNASFYVIVKDINNSNRKILREIHDAGHEIANHSYLHGNLLGYSKEETRQDTIKSTKILSDIIGKRICGYRGPSLTHNNYLMETLVELGYEYDSSINPTFFFILEWIYIYLNHIGEKNILSYFWIKHALSKSFPYMISPPSFFKHVDDGDLVELPISHVPYLNVPFYPTFHFMFPFTYSLFKKRFYKNRFLVYHAHAIDFLDIDEDDVPESFRKHPGISLPWSRKRSYFQRVFKEIRENYSRVVTAMDMARQFRRLSRVAVRD